MKYAITDLTTVMIVDEPTSSSKGTIKRECKRCDYCEYDLITGGEDKVHGIKISSNKEILMLGNTITLTAEIIPGTAVNKSVIWSSLDPQIAGVSDGVVTAKSAGSTVIVVKTVDGGYKDFCLIRVACISPTINSTAVVDYNNGIISGIAPMLCNLDSFVDVTENGLTLNYSNDTIGTGTTVNVCKNGEVVDAYTTVIFGDVNGDGIYDGMDAMIVNCIANGMLTKEQVGEAVYMAADCNHDGVIDNLDVELLQQAGVLLASVDQSKTQEELQTNSAYVEYINLIDQNVDNKSDTPSETEDDGNKSEPNSIFSFIYDLFAFIKRILSFIQAIFA